MNVVLWLIYTIHCYCKYYLKNTHNFFHRGCSCCHSHVYIFIKTIFNLLQLITLKIIIKILIIASLIEWVNNKFNYSFTQRQYFFLFSIHYTNKFLFLQFTVTIRSILFTLQKMHVNRSTHYDQLTACLRAYKYFFFSKKKNCLAKPNVLHVYNEFYYKTHILVDSLCFQ